LKFPYLLRKKQNYKPNKKSLYLRHSLGNYRM